MSDIFKDYEKVRTHCLHYANLHPDSTAVCFQALNRSPHVPTIALNLATVLDDAMLALTAAQEDAGRNKKPFTRREERYFNRLVDRADQLRGIIINTNLSDPSPLEQELHSLDWAIAQLCDRLPDAARQSDK